ncbi:MAG: response regulator transcription factor [Gammaproteobacteria bacterium]|nr:response regulator transcription factor [Gammaproteobacteria bacterium]
MKSALVLEDHDTTRLWLQSIISETLSIDDIALTTTLEQAKLTLLEREFDLALVDINLPDGDGTELVRLLAESHKNTHTIMVTMYDDDQHLFEALKAGAKGYLLKDQSRNEIAQRLKGIISGEPALTPSISRRIIAHFNKEVRPQQHHTLSEREVEVLVLVAKGFQRAEISELLCITTNTASGYIKNIYKKLEVSSRSEAALEAVRLGLIN